MTASWLTALLGGALLRRRRQTILGLAALGSLFAAQAGCGPGTPMSEGTASSASSTGSAMSTGPIPDEVSARMFGTFHDETEDAGRVISEPPDKLFWYPWAMLQVEREGTLSLSIYICESPAEVQKFSWVHIGEDVLQVVPAKSNSDGSFRWKADYVMSVTLSPGPGCDDVVEVIEYLPGSGQSPYTTRYLPGEVCTADDTPEDSKDCNLTFVWCDGAAPPACAAERA